MKLLLGLLFGIISINCQGKSKSKIKSKGNKFQHIFNIYLIYKLNLILAIFEEGQR